MAILQVEKIESNTPPSFTSPPAASTVISLKSATIGVVSNISVELPKTKYTNIEVVPNQPGFSITAAGVLSIDGTNPSISVLPEGTIRNFTLRFYNGVNYVERYYTIVLNIIPPGAVLYDLPNTYTFVVPANINKISAVAVGGGGGGGASWAQSAGSGGALAYANNIAVTPGQSITITVGAGGLGQHVGSTAGGNSSVGSFFSATGGNNGWTTQAVPVSGTVTALGGNGGSSRGTYGGGGGAGGYTGPGGQGGYSNDQTDGQGGGGGGGGGYDSSTYSFGGGGGVGLFGQGVSGAKGQYNNGNSFYSDTRYSGKGGSGGEDGKPNSNGSDSGSGGKFGGGGAGGGTSMNASSLQCRGGSGGVRIIWGTNRTFPFNAS
jgi:hypothetical protein